MTKQYDEGFTLIEVLLVIVVLGILAAVVVASVGGFTDGATKSSCDADAHILEVAVEAYLAQNTTTALPAADGTLDAYENTLSAGGFLVDASELHDLDAAGQLVQVSGSPCTV